MGRHPRPRVHGRRTPASGRPRRRRPGGARARARGNAGARGRRPRRRDRRVRFPRSSELRPAEWAAGSQGHQTRCWAVLLPVRLPEEDRQPLLARPLEERRRRLTALGIRSRSVAVPEHLAEDGEPFLDVVAEYGLEGIVAKRRDSPYIPGTRSGDWLKCHVTPRADVVLGALVEDERRGAVRALCGMFTGDILAFVGEAYVPPYLGRWLDEATRDFTADVSPFATPLPLRTGMRWLRPRIVAIVEHAGEIGELRDARFRALRFDGRLDDCRAEEPIEMESAPPRAGNERPRLVV